MRIGVLTGGGDVPGLNPCIKAIVNRAEENGWEVLGIRRGWGGLLHFDLDQEQQSRRLHTELLTRRSVRIIDRYGGTYLHTSRTNPRKVRPKDLPDFLAGSASAAAGQETIDCTPHILRVVERLGIDLLVPIGGDDTLSFAAYLHTQGFPLVTIPKTMDNDVFGTDYSIGFSTAVTRGVDFIHSLRTSAGSHERIAVVELFGRNSGETALISAYLSGADRVAISEVPFDVEQMARLLREDRERNPSNYAVLVASEGASMTGGQIVEHGQEDAYGHRKLGGIGLVVGETIRHLTGIEIVYQQLAYLMRAGAPDSLDRMVAVSYGNLAIQLIEEGHTGLMVALQDGNYTTVPVETPTQGVRRVDVAELYDETAYRPRVRHLLGKPMFLY